MNSPQLSDRGYSNDGGAIDFPERMRDEYHLRKKSVGLAVFYNKTSYKMYALITCNFLIPIFECG